MSQVAGSSTDGQDNVLHTNAVVHQPRTQEFQMANQSFNVRILGTEEDPWFIAADIGRVLGIDKIAQQVKNYKEGAENGVEE